MEESSTATVPQNWTEKRKHRRCYRLMEKFQVPRKDGMAHIGKSFEIS